MKDQNKQSEYIFVTRTDCSDDENEFVIELFPFSEDLKCDGRPSEIIRNFDELIDFFEKKS